MRFAVEVRLISTEWASLSGSNRKLNNVVTYCESIHLSGFIFSSSERCPSSNSQKTSALSSLVDGTDALRVEHEPAAASSAAISIVSVWEAWPTSGTGESRPEHEPASVATASIPDDASCAASLVDGTDALELPHEPAAVDSAWEAWPTNVTGERWIEHISAAVASALAFGNVLWGNLTCCCAVKLTNPYDLLCPCGCSLSIWRIFRGGSSTSPSNAFGDRSTARILLDYKRTQDNHQTVCEMRLLAAAGLPWRGLGRSRSPMYLSRPNWYLGSKTAGPYTTEYTAGSYTSSFICGTCCWGTSSRPSQTSTDNWVFTFYWLRNIHFAQFDLGWKMRLCPPDARDSCHTVMQ